MKSSPMSEDGLKRVQTIVSDLRMFTHPSTEQLDECRWPGSSPSVAVLSNEWKDRCASNSSLPSQTIRANKTS
jgi:hypothetical protein